MNARIAFAYGPSLTVPFTANFDSGCGRPNRSRNPLGSRDSINSSSRDCNGRLFIVVLACQEHRNGRAHTFSLTSLSGLLAAFAFLMPCRPPLCACDFVFVHPLEHTQTSTSLGLPKRSGKSFGTCFKEQQRQVGQRTVPSASMTPSSGSKTHVRLMGRSVTSEPEIRSIDTIFITLSLERTLSHTHGSAPGNAPDSKIRWPQARDGSTPFSGTILSPIS